MWLGGVCAFWPNRLDSRLLLPTQTPFTFAAHNTRHFWLNFTPIPPVLASTEHRPRSQHQYPCPALHPTPHPPPHPLRPHSSHIILSYLPHRHRYAIRRGAEGENHRRVPTRTRNFLNVILRSRDSTLLATSWALYRYGAVLESAQEVKSLDNCIA